MNLLLTVHVVNNIKSTVYTVVFCCSVLTQVNIHMDSNINWEKILTDTKQWLFLHCKLAPPTTQLKSMYNIRHLLQKHYCTLLLKMWKHRLQCGVLWLCESKLFYRCPNNEETSCYVHVNRVLLFVRLLLLCVSIGMHQSAVIYVSRAMQILSVWRSTYKPCIANCGHTSVR